MGKFRQETTENKRNELLKNKRTICNQHFSEKATDGTTRAKLKIQTEKI